MTVPGPPPGGYWHTAYSLPLVLLCRARSIASWRLAAGQWWRALARPQE